jgi:formate-dependent nitrite reductase membrane component NrfD
MELLETVLSLLYVLYAASFTFSLSIVYDVQRNHSYNPTASHGYWSVRNAAAITAGALALHLMFLVIGVTAPESVVDNIADVFSNYSIPEPYVNLSDTATTMAMFADAVQVYLLLNLIRHMYFRHTDAADDHYLKPFVISGAAVGLLATLFLGAKDGGQYVWIAQVLLHVPAIYYIAQTGAEIGDRKLP